MKKEVKETILIVIGICVIALAALYFSGATDSESSTMRFNADSVCFIAGHYDGVSRFNYRGNHTYEFTCDDGRTKVEFDGMRGVIRYDNSKE